MGITGPIPRTWEEVLEAIQNNSHLKEDTNCFIWEGHTISGGYGAICYLGKQQYIHRLIYIHLMGGDYTKIVRHTCDNKPCWNPKHLIGGTHQDNVDDKVSKLRHQYGSNHYCATITEEIAKKIKSGDLSKHEAKLLGASYSTYYGILSNRIWKHV